MLNDEQLKKKKNKRMKKEINGRKEAGERRENLFLCQSLIIELKRNRINQLHH